MGLFRDVSASRGEGMVSLKRINGDAICDTLS